MTFHDPRYTSRLQGDVHQEGKRVVIQFPSHRLRDHVSRGTADIGDDFMNVVENAENLLWITRDSELQKDAVRELDSMVTQLESIKECHIEAENEDRANLMLGLQCVVQSTMSELMMYECLRQENPGDAWDWLVGAQNSVLAAARAHESLASWSDARHVWLFNIEGVMFPKQTFMSIGGTIDDSECSICKDDLMNCDHEPGNPYNGRFCNEVIKKMDMAEVSLVDNPRDKRARVTSFEGKDALTGRVMESDEEQLNTGRLTGYMMKFDEE